MNDRNADDLFEQSTMTFGEHLEEFRAALAKALTGVLIGVVLAIPFCTKAVDFVKTPLEKALRRVELKKAERDLKAQGGPPLSPESWAMLQGDSMVPQLVQLDVDEIVGQLSRVGAVQPTDKSGYLFSNDSLKDPVAVAKVIHAGSQHWMTTSAKDVWQQLKEDEQAQLAVMATSTEEAPDKGDDETNGEGQATKTKNADTLVAILNRLISDPDLATVKPFSEMETLIENDGPRDSLIQLQKDIAETGQGHERLNRWLLAAALELPELSTKPRVINVRMWQPPDIDIIATKVEEPFMILVKAVIVLALIIASPWVFYQIWNFVASGLYPQERNYVYTYLPFSLGLFFAGASLAFAFVFQPVLDFLFGFNLMLNIEATPKINEWVGFVLFLPIGFGISFQLPLVMLLLERMGIVTIKSYTTRWRIAILVICVLSMFLTPSDPTSMMLMAAPLTLLYFAGIALCRYMPRKQSPFGPAADPV